MISTKVSGVVGQEYYPDAPNINFRKQARYLAFAHYEFPHRSGSSDWGVNSPSVAGLTLNPISLRSTPLVKARNRVNRADSIVAWHV